MASFAPPINPLLTALSTGGALVNKNQAVLIGDSTARQQVFGDPPNLEYYDMKGMWNCANAVLGAPLDIIACCGMSGKTTTDIRARMGTGNTIIAPGVIGGTNTAVTTPGSGYVVGDQITMANGLVLQVASVSGGGVVSATFVNNPSWLPNANPKNVTAQTSTTGAGTGVVFTFEYWLDPLYFNPGFYLLTLGTNDPTNSIPAATTIANLKAIIALCRARGAEVVLATLAPNAQYSGVSSSAGALQRRSQSIINQWIRDYCRVTPGVRLADKNYTSNDPSVNIYKGYTGSSLTPVLSSDGTHDNQAGGMANGVGVSTTTFFDVKQVNTSGANLNDINYIYNSILIGSNATGTKGTTLGTGVSGNAPNGVAVYQKGTGTAVASTVTRSTSADSGLQLVVTTIANGDGVTVYLGGDDVGGKGRLDGVWATATVYAEGQKVYPKGSNSSSPLGNLIAVCTTGGTSHATTEPVWPTQEAQTIADGTVTWQMLAAPTPVYWLASRYAALGAVIKPGSSTAYALQCTTAGQSSGSQPTWNTGLGQTTTDGTSVWTTITPPTYTVYGEVEVLVSSVTASKGVAISTYIQYIDNSGTFDTVRGCVSDTTAGSVKAWPYPAYQKLRTPPYIINPGTAARYLELRLSIAADAGTTLTVQIFRPTIRPVTQY